MSQNNLECFISAAYHLNFTKAAKERHISQVTMSRYISNLENEIGVPLFNRLNRGVSLTSAGERLLVCQATDKQGGNEKFGYIFLRKSNSALSSVEIATGIFRRPRRFPEGKKGEVPMA